VRERVNQTKADEMQRSAASMSASQLYKRIDELRNAACSEGFAQQCTKAESFRDAHNQTFELLENTRKYYLRKLPRRQLLSLLHEVAEKHCGSGSVDLAFLMDCTGSMASWIEVAKTQLFKIVENTKAKLGVKMRVAYVGCALGLQPFGIEPSSFLAAF
jgi:translation initiation factor 2 alpha subunit (eIF-2alpha)